MPDGRPRSLLETAHRLRRQFRRSFLDFLALPILIGFGFVVLAEIVDWFDNHAGPRSTWTPLRMWLSQYVGDTQAAIGVLSAIAGSLFTVTSVTFSILLLAVQQGATVLNSQIIDHYLRRRSNRVWFGFFVGVSLFALITLVQTTHTKAPVFGVTVSTLLGAVALVALIVLIYATVNQIRPATVLRSIKEAAEQARIRQQPMLFATADAAGAELASVIRVEKEGYLVGIDLPRLGQVMDGFPSARLNFLASLGDFVPAGVPVAAVDGFEANTAAARQVLACLSFAEERDLAGDPAYSLDHIATIGWTAISSAHSDPAVGAIAIRALQQLLHAWALPVQRQPQATARIFYRDVLFDQVVDSLESLVVAATESRQHQSVALVLRMLASSLPVLPAVQQKKLFALVTTVVPALADHLPTRSLRGAVTALIASYESFGASEQAAELRTGLSHLLARDA